MSKLTLDSVEWTKFKLIDIFDIKDGYYNKKPPKIGTENKIPFLGATQFNNGITEYYSFDTIKSWDKTGKFSEKGYEKRIFKGNCLAVTNNGSVGNVYYQEYRFTCSHDITVLYLKNKNLNKYIAQFLASMLQKSGESFEYAKKWRPKRMRKSFLLLPIDSQGKPNWKFMEDYIKQEMKEQSRKIVRYYKNKLLKLGFELVDLDVEWKEFKIIDIFDVKSVTGKTSKSYKDGDIPFISTSSADNGLNNFIYTEGNISDENCISVDPIAGKTFYHQYQFVGRGGAGSAINLLYNENLDEYSSMFLCRVIESTSTEKASYGVQLNGNRLRNLRIQLPVDKNGNPYWEYMRNFVKKLEKENIDKVLEYIYIYIG